MHCDRCRGFIFVVGVAADGEWRSVRYGLGLQHVDPGIPKFLYILPLQHYWFNLFKRDNWFEVHVLG